MSTECRGGPPEQERSRHLIRAAREKSFGIVELADAAGVPGVQSPADAVLAVKVAKQPWKTMRTEFLASAVDAAVPAPLPVGHGAVAMYDCLASDTYAGRRGLIFEKDSGAPSRRGL